MPSPPSPWPLPGPPPALREPLWPAPNGISRGSPPLNQRILCWTPNHFHSAPTCAAHFHPAHLRGSSCFLQPHTPHGVTPRSLHSCNSQAAPGLTHTLASAYSHLTHLGLLQLQVHLHVRSPERLSGPMMSWGPSSCSSLPCLSSGHHNQTRYLVAGKQHTWTAYSLQAGSPDQPAWFTPAASHCAPTGCRQGGSAEGPHQRPRSSLRAPPRAVPR